MTEKRFKNNQDFVSDVEQLLGYYINNLTSFPLNAKLLVQAELGECVIDDPSKCKGCDDYDIKDFVKRSSDGDLTPNEQAVMQMASLYYPNI